MKNTEWIVCESIVAGDVIKWTESIWGGSYRRPRWLGEREVVAEVLRESYGLRTAQHSFTLKVLESSDGLLVGSTIRRMGRNLYGGGARRRLWSDEGARAVVAEEKHERGRSARQMARERREMYQ